MKCPVCGVFHVEEKKFCDYCGARLTRRTLKGLFAAAIMVVLFLGSYLFTTGVLSIHEKSPNDKTQRPLTAAPVRAVKNSLRPMRSVGASPVMARPTAKIEGGFAVAQADDKSADAEAASPGTATPDSHVADQTESKFNLMRDPLNAEK
jgi:hypothetical protein